MEWECLKGLGIDRKPQQKKNHYRLPKFKKEKILVIKVKKRIPYKDYLKSKHWQNRRKRFWVKFKKICFCCNGKATEIHHNSYLNKWNEPDKDLVALCRNCHQEITDMEYRKEVTLKEAHVVYRQILSLRLDV